MKVIHVFKSGTKSDTVKGHKLPKEKQRTIQKIIMEVNKGEKKVN